MCGLISLLLEYIGQRSSEQLNVSNDFKEAVFIKTQEIPSGFVMSYKDVACAIGFPNRARHVGSALSLLPTARSHPTSTDCVPWWRVIRSDGSIAMQGSDSRGQIQYQLLKKENVPFRGKRIQIKDCRWIYI